MLAADVLVTDYSSMMFDFANTGRPMLFFTYDLDAYRDEIRGFYFDFLERAPGPLLATSDEVAEALRDPEALRAQYAERYAEFAGRVLRARRRARLRPGGGPRLRSGIRFESNGRSWSTQSREVPDGSEGRADDRGIARGDRRARSRRPATATSPYACRRAGATSSASCRRASTSSSAQNARMAKELARLARVVGRDGRMTERAVLPGALRRLGRQRSRPSTR